MGNWTLVDVLPTIASSPRTSDRRPQPPARRQRRRVVPARFTLEAGEAAVRVPEHERRDPRGTGEDVGGG